MHDRWSDQTECASVKEMIDAVKTHYKAVGGTVVSADDPKNSTMGFAVERTRWFVRYGYAFRTLRADEDSIYADFMRTPTGREQLAKLIMTAARSEPPPPMHQDEEE